MNSMHASPVLNFRLKRAKESLHRQNEECARIRSENMEMEDEMGQLEEIHK